MLSMRSRLSDTTALDNLLAATRGLFERKYASRCYSSGPAGEMRPRNVATYQLDIVTTRHGKRASCCIEVDAASAIEASDIAYEQFGPCEIVGIFVRRNRC